MIPDQWSAMRAAIVGLAFSHGARQARYVPVGHEGGELRGDLLDAAGPTVQISRVAVLERLRPLLEDPAVKKVGHDLKFD